jgi:hypothetical protein
MTEHHLAGCAPEKIDDFDLWQGRVRAALRSLGGSAALGDIEWAISRRDPGVFSVPGWTGKVWNVILLDPDIGSVMDGVWELAASEEDLGE